MNSVTSLLRGCLLVTYAVSRLLHRGVLCDAESPDAIPEKESEGQSLDSRTRCPYGPKKGDANKKNGWNGA